MLYAETHEEAVRLIVDIAKHHGVRKVTKSKSMVSEEIGLNHAFEAAGIQPVETDLGEYILQINDNEAPSHIIAPVIHKDKEEISDLFAQGPRHAAQDRDHAAHARGARGAARPLPVARTWA